MLKKINGQNLTMTIFKELMFCVELKQLILNKCDNVGLKLYRYLKIYVEKRKNICCEAIKNYRYAKTNVNYK